MTEQVLIATLGVEPQVVTLVLDLLIDQGYPIKKAIVVHTSGKAVQAALKTLSLELGPSQPILLEKVAIIHEKRPVADILTDEDVGAFLRTVYHVVLKEKRAGRTLLQTAPHDRATVLFHQTQPYSPLPSAPGRICDRLRSVY